jgi:predicted nucleic acid-binding protein
MLVVDSSAIVAALVGGKAARGAAQRLAADGDLHAPHLIDIEVLSALRCLVRGADLAPDRANDARLDFSDLTIVRYGHEPLSERIWELRDNVTAYDAAYLALAEALGAPLVTCDGALASAPGHGATVEHFEAG